MPDTALLLRWLLTWVQPDGAIHGFHNHSVWGGNPWRHGDLWCGHSTWASPLIPAVARAHAAAPDPRAAELLRRLVAFQTASFQDNGNYRHVGFQCGELLKHGLIHNVIVNASLGEAAAVAGDPLGDAGRDAIRAAFDRNTPSHGPARGGGCCNQEYCRVWAKLLHARAFGRTDLRDAAFADLDVLAEAFHVPGVPDDECDGALRVAADRSYFEPAEYYGLMVLPLVEAYEQSGGAPGSERFLDRALRLCRHVVRSMWTDAHGRARLHRLWRRDRGGGWLCQLEPMLIGGGGDTLEGLTAVLRHRDDPALLDARDRLLATLAGAQTPGGAFLPATGWGHEADVAPSSAWHAHDARALLAPEHLAAGVAADDTFWDRVFAPPDPPAPPHPRDPRRRLLLAGAGPTLGRPRLPVPQRLRPGGPPRPRPLRLGQHEPRPPARPAGPRVPRPPCRSSPATPTACGRWASCPRT